MVENRTDHDTTRRVRALVAGVLTSGALVTGALTVAPPATAACTAGESGCPSPADSAAPPTQAELNQATVDYLLARGEAVRLEAIFRQADREYWAAPINWKDPHFREIYGAASNARWAYKVADEKAIAAGEVVTQLEKRRAEAAARDAAPRRAEEDREAAKWGGPTHVEFDDAVNQAKRAKDEADRLRAVFEDARRKTQETTALYYAGFYPNHSLLLEAQNAAFYESNVAAEKLRAANEAVTALQNRAAEAAKKREAQEDADFRDKARWGGATHDELVEANNRTLALRDEGLRLQAIVDKAQKEADDAWAAYGMNDPRYQEKLRIWKQAIDATTPVYHREDAAGNYYKSLTDKVRAADARRTEEAAAAQQEERNIWGATAAELEEATESLQAARDEAAPLQVIADKANQELTDARRAYGSNDARTQEKSSALNRAVEELKRANKKESEARTKYESLTTKVARAAARRTPREEAELQSAKDAATAPDTEADRLRAKAAKAWLDLQHAAEFYGPTSNDPHYQEKLKAYEAASKLVKPSADETTNTTPAPADSTAKKDTGTASKNDTAKTDEDTSGQGTDASTTGERPDAEKPSTEKASSKRPERAADNTGASDPEARGTDGSGAEATPE